MRHVCIVISKEELDFCEAMLRGETLHVNSNMQISYPTKAWAGNYEIHLGHQWWPILDEEFVRANIEGIRWLTDKIALNKSNLTKKAAAEGVYLHPILAEVDFW